MKVLKKVNVKKEKSFYVENELARIQASFRLEGQNLSDEELEHCKLVIENKVSIDDAIAQVIRAR
jgi:hypothetical protein